MTLQFYLFSVTSAIATNQNTAKVTGSEYRERDSHTHTAGKNVRLYVIQCGGSLVNSKLPYPR